jgi:hypothetical protein
VANQQVPGRMGLVCMSCGSATLREFSAKTGIHFPGLRNIDKPVVWVSAGLFVCMNCGTNTTAFAELQDSLPESGQFRRCSSGSFKHGRWGVCIQGALSE